MSRLRRSRLAFTACVLAIATSAADEQPFAYCTTCHGAQGNGNLAIRAPKIAGMEAWYLQRQLEAFRDGVRGSHADDIAGQEMQPVGTRLGSSTDIALAIRYVQAFAPQPTRATVTGNIERGKALYRACSTCHGTRGEGNEAVGAPALANRSDWYLATQLRNYSSGIRGADPRDTHGAQMRAAASVLTDAAAIDDVVAFVGTF